jgi:hypothetical protein
MSKLEVPLVKLAICATLLSLAGSVEAQSNDFATGNMHFDAREMDTNGDHMISREEMVAYAEKTWEMMSHGKDTIPVGIADADFGSGGVNFTAHTIDTDHDGTISKQEFISYATRKFDGMKKANGLVSIEDMVKATVSGNTYSGKSKS